MSAITTDTWCATRGAGWIVLGAAPMIDELVAGGEPAPRGVFTELEQRRLWFLSAGP